MPGHPGFSPKRETSLTIEPVEVSRISNESRKLVTEIMREERCTQSKEFQVRHESCKGVGYNWSQLCSLTNCV